MGGTFATRTILVTIMNTFCVTFWACNKWRFIYAYKKEYYIINQLVHTETDIRNFIASL